jgi:hypothetical protein
LQVLGILFRKIMGHLNFEQVGKLGYHYDMMPERLKRIPQHGIEIAAGYITGIRQHESSLLLNIFSHHKIMRTDTAYDVMVRTRSELQQQGRIGELQSEIKARLVGCVVITR